MNKTLLFASSSPFDIWLDSEIEYYDKPEIYNSKYNNISFYYNINDVELNMKNHFLIENYKQYLENETYLDLYNKEDEEIYDRMAYIQHYTFKDKDKFIYINPNTNRYIVDLLFRKLLDNSQDLTTPNDTPLINKNMRTSFYKFCYEHSKH